MAIAESGVPGSIEQIQELTEHLESVADPGVRAIAEELVAAVVQMYGAGIERMLELIDEHGDGAGPIGDAFAGDDLVASLMLIHDLHPVPVEERAMQALDRIRPYMESHGGDVELLGVHDGIARLRLQGSCKSCRASSATLELAVRQALEELCPDLEGMDVEGLGGEPELAGFPGVALPMAGGAGADRNGSAWHDVEGVQDLEPGALAASVVGGTPLVITNVDGTLLAYRDSCASCGADLGGAELNGATLVCKACARGFVLTQAGRCLDDEALQLEPVPLLRRGSSVQVGLEI